MFSPEAKILIVDDAESMRHFISAQLEGAGYKRVVYATNGEEAWNIIEDSEKSGDPVHLVLTDRNMSKLSGVELVRRIRGNPSTRDLPVLMLSAERSSQCIVEAVSAGVSGYLIKPVNQAKLKTELKSAWDYHHSPKSANKAA